MVRTWINCKGNSEHYNNTELKRCTGCLKVFYCSAQCQKDDWVHHIFHCKPRHPITTANHLALAVHERQLPVDAQTTEDYGFNRVFAAEDKSNLLGLYSGLIQRLRIPPKTIHRWRINGVLFEEIKATYSKDPDRSDGGWFPWFLQKEYLFTGEPMSDETLREHNNDMFLRAWRFIGGSEKDSGDDVMAAIRRKPIQDRLCFMMYSLTLSNWHPSPELEEWVQFGFAACTSIDQKFDLGLKYRELMNRCTFQEFCDAFTYGRLLDLFRSKEVPLHASRQLQDILNEPAGGYKSVWFLKQFVQEPDNKLPELPDEVAVHYGFVNCRDDSEKRQLVRVYNAFFENNGDPLALHQAAIKGNIHGFLSKSVQGLRDPKFRRLTKNIYTR